MDETTAAIRKICGNELLVAESKIKFYRRLLGKLRACELHPRSIDLGGVSPVENNADCAEEVENLRSQLQEKTKELDNLQRYIAQQKSENEVLHRKVNNLGNKYRQACRERDELAEKLRIAEEDDKKRSLLIETLNQLSFDEES